MTSAGRPTPNARRRSAGGSRRAKEAALSVLAHRLSDDELELLVLIAARVRAGHQRYGCLRLVRDRRDFGREALEELADAMFYLAARLLRAGRAGHGDRKASS